VVDFLPFMLYNNIIDLVDGIARGPMYTANLVQIGVLGY
jgi:hypothetical protein